VRTSSSSKLKSRPGSTPRDRRVLDHRHLRPDRADVAGRPQLGGDLLLPRLAEAGAERVPQLDLVEAMVAADQHEDHAAVLDDHRQRLDQRSGRHAERPRDLLDRGQARGGDALRGRERRRQLDRLRLSRSDLDVGRVAGRHGDLVLPRRAGRHELVGARAAHHPDVGFDPIPAQPAAVEDASVGARLQLVGARQPLLVAVEGVGVLHRELARAQEACARPRLVALLGLDVEQHQRQVAVGAHLAGDVGGDRLLVGQRQHQRRALAVLELEQLLDLVAARLPPRLGRLQDRHQHLLGADRLHLLAQDRLDLALDPPSRRQERPQAGAELADQPRPDHQLVRKGLRVRRGLLQGGEECLREPSHA
jgi:hypothetical protein